MAYVTKCIDCSCRLPRPAPRILYGGGWRCSDCAIEFERGEKMKRVPARPRYDRKHPQREELF